MKTLYLVFVVLFFASCTTKNPKEDSLPNKLDSTDLKTEIQKNDNENAILHQLAHKWTLIKRSDKKKEKKLKFSKNLPSLVTHFENNGYFMIYDVMKMEEDEGKAASMKLRTSGQWEIHNQNNLVLRYSVNDTAEVDHYIIKELNDTLLILKAKNKDFVNTYVR